MINPRVSIITACFNAARTIEDTIQSVLSQNYPNLEYIVIDGASTDGTLGILDKYRHRIFKIVSEPDNGIYDAFNKGISLATGDLIGILNADDFYAPWTLQIMANAYLEHPQYAVYHGKMFYFDESSRWWQITTLHEPDLLLEFMCIAHPSCFIPRKIYDKHGVFDMSYSIAADWDFLIRLYLAREKFFAINKTLVAMRSGGASNSEKCTLEVCKILKKYSGIESARKYIAKLRQPLSWRRGNYIKTHDVLSGLWGTKPEIAGKIRKNWICAMPFEFPWRFIDETENVL